MWIADNWKDYEVIDTSSGEKLERWGDFLLIRPDPQVIISDGKNLTATTTEAARAVANGSSTISPRNSQ